METAVVGIVGAFIGILLTNVLRVYFDWRNRRERVRDIQTALRAEIRSHRHALEYFEDDERASGVIALMESDAHYIPFITREVDPPIFTAIVGDIHILPGSVIDAVVIFYRQAKTLAGMTDDMRDDRYRSLPPNRKVQMYRDYLALGAYALELADDALGAIESALAAGVQR
ncbi:MAG: hypothetical protein Q7T08_13795 [Devosia sp.]|nr:hypothetical protein [Devosia sp.]